jgi:hypothetical protein
MYMGKIFIYVSNEIFNFESEAALPACPDSTNLA